MDGFYDEFMDTPDDNEDDLIHENYYHHNRLRKKKRSHADMYRYLEELTDTSNLDPSFFPTENMTINYWK